MNCFVLKVVVVFSLHLSLSPSHLSSPPRIPVRLTRTTACRSGPSLTPSKSLSLPFDRLYFSNSASPLVLKSDLISPLRSLPPWQPEPVCFFPAVFVVPFLLFPARESSTKQPPWETTHLLLLHQLPPATTQIFPSEVIARGSHSPAVKKIFNCCV